MKETKTTGNSRHADPTTGSPPIELLSSAAAVCTADVVQAARWKYAFQDVCKKTHKSFIIIYYFVIKDWNVPFTDLYIDILCLCVLLYLAL